FSITPGQALGAFVGAATLIGAANNAANQQQPTQQQRASFARPVQLRPAGPPQMRHYGRAGVFSQAPEVTVHSGEAFAPSTGSSFGPPGFPPAPPPPPPP
ncbi:hypothetical protein PMAYCL1PPCAC_04549, partial [Pristionchus mayeri]